MEDKVLFIIRNGNIQKILKKDKKDVMDNGWNFYSLEEAEKQLKIFSHIDNYSSKNFNEDNLNLFEYENDNQNKDKADTILADELQAWLDNTQELYKMKMEVYVPALQKKINKGIYDETKAIKLLVYLFDRVRADYEKNFGKLGRISQKTKDYFANEVLKDLKLDEILVFEKGE